MEISVVIPVYGSKDTLKELHNRLVNSLEKFTDEFEIILVNDNCPQNSWETIEEICKMDKRVVGVNLSRNFGQQKAISAGIDYAIGNWVVVMDCDLQDRPEEIYKLYTKAIEGYDVVFARRADRKDKALKKLTSKLFYKVYNNLTGDIVDDKTCNFSISKKIVIENFCKMKEQNRAYHLFIKWLGFKQTSIDVEHAKREVGESSYNFVKRLKLATELITAQSNKPLILSMKFGFLVSLISFLYIVYLVVSYLFFGGRLEGWTSLIASIYLVGGIIITNIGVVGLYIGQIFNETKKRPLYVVKDILNNKINKE